MSILGIGAACVQCCRSERHTSAGKPAVPGPQARLIGDHRSLRTSRGRDDRHAS